MACLWEASGLEGENFFLFTYCSKYLELGSILLFDFYEWALKAVVSMKIVMRQA